MTKKQYRLAEWEAVMSSRGTCTYCDEPATESAHIIAQTKANIKKYGFFVIQSQHNQRKTCHSCNSKAMGEARGDAERGLIASWILCVLVASGIDPFTGPRKSVPGYTRGGVSR